MCLLCKSDCWQTVKESSSGTNRSLIKEVQAFFAWKMPYLCLSLENLGGPGGGAGRGAHLREARDLETQEPGGRPHLKPWRAVVPVALPLSDTYSPHAVRR